MKKLIVPVLFLFIGCNSNSPAEGDEVKVEVDSAVKVLQDVNKGLKKLDTLESSVEAAFERIDKALENDSLEKSEKAKVVSIKSVEAIEESKPFQTNEKKIEVKVEETKEVVKNKLPVLEEKVKVAAEPVKIDYDKVWASLLTHVSPAGEVDYKALLAKKKDIEDYLSHLDEIGPSKGSALPEISYYINLYNATTINLILDNYPLKSIRDIGEPWEKPIVKMGGKVYTLNALENEIIRPKFKNAKIHFALNCAAVSCPKLLNEPYGEDYKRQLNKMTKRFLRDKDYGLRVEGKKVYISQIFEWYADDFGGKDNLIKWVDQFTTEDLSGKKLGGFIEYNWALNSN